MRQLGVALMLGWCACQDAAVIPPGGSGGMGGGVSGSGGGSAGAGGSGGMATALLGASPLQRLRRSDFDNTVGDLFGLTESFTASFPAEERAGGFDNQAGTLSFSPLLAEKLMEAAEAVAERATLPSCAATDAPCVEAWIDSFGARVFRRPLVAAEHQAFFDLYQTLKAADGHPQALRTLLSAWLQSPQFLYRLEPARPGELPGDSIPLDGYEVASRLSYSLWNTMPDAELFAAAQRGELATAPQVEAQARRMLVDPKAKRRVNDFFFQWLDLGTLSVTFRAEAPFPRIRGILDDESALLAADIFWNGKSPALFNATYSFGNTGTALLYGGTASGPQLQRVELDAAQRPGLFTRGAFLAVHATQAESSPFKRGRFLRERVLCQTLYDPPAGVPMLPEPLPGQTTRERFAAHSSAPECSGCHRLIDGLGFGLENYDSIGKWRSQQEGKPIDASGELFAIPGLSGTYVGASELMNKLATAEAVQQCLVQTWFRFQLGRVELSEDALSHQAAWQRFQSSQFDLKELVIALTTTDAFRYRRSPAD